MRLRRLLSRKVSIEAMIEFGMWLAIPYIVIGIGWSFVNADYVGQLETELVTLLPAGANLVAFGITTSLWPLLLIAANMCAA
jgi:hypothetical protein